MGAQVFQEPAQGTVAQLRAAGFIEQGGVLALAGAGAGSSADVVVAVASAKVVGQGGLGLERFDVQLGGSGVLMLGRERGDARQPDPLGRAGDNMVCGVCFCDANRDGLLDIVLGQHFATPWRESVPNKLFINRGIKDGVPVFEEVILPHSKGKWTHKGARAKQLLKVKP
jgi:hypothetical protein